MHTPIFNSRRVALGLTRVTVVGALFSLRDTLSIAVLSSLLAFIAAHFALHVPLNAWLGIYVGFAVCAHFLWHWVVPLVYEIAS